MKTLLKIALALRGCRHRWEQIGEIEKTAVSDGRTVEIRSILRCKRCGDQKAVRL